MQIPAIKAIVEDCTKKISELSPVVEVARQQTFIVIVPLQRKTD